MNIKSYKFFFFICELLFGLLGQNTFAAKGTYYNAAIIPEETDNFFEASVRVWLPEDRDTVRGVLVFLGGTDSDSRNFAEKKEWQDLARSQRLALAGCYFRGDGEPYEEAAGGSGAALSQMLDRISGEAGRPELRDAPMLLMGHSAGAMFSYNFACWAPERVLAFISIKSGPINSSLNPKAQKVPGLFILGEEDLPCRVRTVANVYAQSSAPNRMWALAVEPHGGHGGSKETTELITAYIEELVPLHFIENSRAGLAEKGSYRSLTNPASLDNPVPRAPDLVWLPGILSAEKWQGFTKKISVEELVKKGGQDENASDSYFAGTIDFGHLSLEASGEALEKKFTFRVPNMKAGKYSFSSSDKRLIVTSEKPEASDLCSIIVRLNASELKTGWYKESIIGHSPNGPRIEVRVFAKIISSIIAQPSSIYLGVIPRGTVIEKSVTLKTTSKQPLHLVDIQSSKPKFATLISIRSSNDSITVVFRFNAGKALGNQSGHFDLKCGRFEHEQIRIPFIAWISKSR